MSDARDILRWNRAGLRRFRYIDGNAVTWLEHLRSSLASRFGERWLGVAASGPARTAQHDARDNETAEQRTERLLTQYRAPRSPEPDWGWEIARAFARACHVLTEHLDAYANEGYVGTASQWECLRQLVSTIEYHPAAKTSAAVPLALLATTPGHVEPGLAFRHAPADGSPPIIFETFERIDVDPRLNCLFAAPTPSTAPLSGDRLPLDGKVTGLHPGAPLAFEAQPESAGGPRCFSAHILTAVSTTHEGTEICFTPPLDAVAGNPSFVRGRTIVHLRPSEQLPIIGPRAETVYVGLEFDLEQLPVGLCAGETVRLIEANQPQPGACYRSVARVCGTRVTLSTAVERTITLPTAVTRMIAVRPLSVAGLTAKLGGNFAYLNGKSLVAADLTTEYQVTVVRSDSTETELTLSAPPTGTAPFWLPIGGQPWSLQAPLLPATGNTALFVGQPSAPVPEGVAVVTGSGGLAWAHVAVDSSSSPSPARVSPNADGWHGADDPAPRPGEGRLYAGFSAQLRVRGWQDRDQKLRGTQIPVENLPASLRLGRRVIAHVAGTPGVVCTAVSGLGSNELMLDDAVPPGATSATLRIYANVVTAGHGERRPQRLLGSGNATRANQRFVLPEQDVATIADRSFPRGCRSDVVVTVDGRMWLLVPHLRLSGPADPVYSVEVAEDGSMGVTFGDGEHGRRLPSGVNNVRISYRVGAGPRGNIPGGSLSRPARNHPFVDGAFQPFSAAGGKEMEAPETMRQAAGSVLTLNRAVTLRDIADLANQDGRVWQARALRRPGSRRGEHVEVVVVPADGGNLEAIGNDIAASLMAKTLAGVTITVSKYDPLELQLDVTVYVDSTAYEGKTVAANVGAALTEAFSLHRRRIGQPLLLSEVYDVVQQVPGVEQSVCKLNNDPTLQRITAAPRQVIHFSQAAPALHVTASGEVP